MTNEDPYDDPPDEIIRRIAEGAETVGKRENETLCIEDRQQAIDLAMKMAGPGDVVLLTGKGAEPWICVANERKVPWNEAEAARTAIQRVLSGR